MLAAKASESSFIEHMSFSINGAARFIGVPGDLIDAPAGGSEHHIRMFITQRHLQLLIINLGPGSCAARMRSPGCCCLGPGTRKLNPGALLRMDQQSRYEILGEVGIRSLPAAV